MTLFDVMDQVGQKFSGLNFEIFPILQNLINLNLFFLLSTKFNFSVLHFRKTRKINEEEKISKLNFPKI